MKKIWGLATLAGLFLLVACGGNSETVCTIEDNFYGGKMIATFETDDNEIIAATVELIMDITDMDDEEVQGIIDRETRDDDIYDIEYVIDGDTLIFSQTIEGDQLDDHRMQRDLDEMVAEMENNGAECE